MQILTKAELPLKTPVAVALGFFDGLHRGHMALLRCLKEQPYKTLVYTFDRKPNVPRPLFTPSERASILECAGIDFYYAASFDAAFRDQSPRAFLTELTRNFNVKTIVVGNDFRFGSDAAGDVHYLADQAAAFGYSLDVVKLRGNGHEKYSSTILRQLVHEGRIQEANDIMDRAYFIDGVVEKGAQIGRTIGFPTANIETDKILPAFGVYATLTRTPDGLFKSVTNVGKRPTLNDGRRASIESHLLDHNESLYEQPVRIYFIDRLRPEIRFNSLDQLKEQIETDSMNADKVLSSTDVYSRHELC